MRKARVFKSGNSQAVRLPKQFRFHVDEVEILRRGREIVLREPKRNLAEAFAALGSLPEDFMADGRQNQPPPETGCAVKPRYMLDTNICIYIAKQQPPEVKARFDRLKPGRLIMSVITYAELYDGANKSSQRAKALAQFG